MKSLLEKEIEFDHTNWKTGHSSCLPVCMAEINLREDSVDLPTLLDLMRRLKIEKFHNPTV
jgi:hypothetical protein